jgi:hypothetical protein
MQTEATRTHVALPPVFVVGTGRCGSTLVSNILRAHPGVLSLSEFFTFITDLGTLNPPFAVQRFASKAHLCKNPRRIGSLAESIS